MIVEIMGMRKGSILAQVRALQLLGCTCMCNLIKPLHARVGELVSNLGVNSSTRLLGSTQGALSWLETGFPSVGDLMCSYGFYVAKQCIFGDSWKLMFSKFCSNQPVASKILGVWRRQTGPEPNIENIQWWKKQRQDRISAWLLPSTA